MIVINGFEELIKKRDSLPNVGWIYVEDSFNLSSVEDIKKRKYFIVENEDEEMDCEENYATFLESPMFKAVINNRLNHHPNSSKEELLEAVTYYLEEDDFLE